MNDIYAGRFKRANRYEIFNIIVYLPVYLFKSKIILNAEQ